MSVSIEYKIVKTYSKPDNYGIQEAVAVEPAGNYYSPYMAMQDARALADEHMRYGADCESHPELDIINGTDQLVIDIYPVVLIGGEEVEAEGYIKPIESLTVSAAALRNYHDMKALRAEYNRLNEDSGDAYTSLY